MGARGPKPRPTALRIIDGNPSGRPLNEKEPAPIGRARCPIHLSKVGRARWKRIVAAMPPGFYTPADEALLAAYCEAWSDHVKATKTLDDGASIIVKTPAGGVSVSPLLIIRARTAATMAMLGTRLGLSPADRSGLAAPAVAEKGGKWDGLLAS